MEKLTSGDRRHIGQLLRSVEEDAKDVRSRLVNTDDTGEREELADTAEAMASDLTRIKNLLLHGRKKNI